MYMYEECIYVCVQLGKGEEISRWCTSPLKIRRERGGGGGEFNTFQGFFFELVKISHKSTEPWVQPKKGGGGLN
jgi:hypothetical protein